MVNVIKKHLLFPTAVCEFKFIPDNKLVNAIKDEDLDFSPKNFARSTVQSKDQNLHRKKSFEGFTNKILESTKEVCQLYGYKYDKLEITNLWINFSEEGSAHNPHTHSNNIFSGVWFPFKNTSQTPMIYLDPRQQTNIFQPNIFERNNLNSSLMAFQPDEGRGLIFPAWLTHYVPPAIKKRISLSWNIILRGDYGEPKNLQTAHI